MINSFPGIFTGVVFLSDCLWQLYAAHLVVCLPHSYVDVKYLTGLQVRKSQKSKITKGIYFVLVLDPRAGVVDTPAALYARESACLEFETRKTAKARMKSAMYTGLYASHRALCLEEQCLAHLTHYEP